MARTPLLQSLVRLAREHAVAERDGLPVEAVREREATLQERRALSRRQVLAAGAAATVAAMARPRTALGAGAPRIVIIGGGVAGLNAALTLLDAGLESTVYEASGRTGGRIFSNTTYFAQGQVSEWCGELIDSHHPVMRSLVRRYRLPTTDLIQGQPNGSEDTLHFFGKYYSKEEADRDFQPVHQALQGDVQAASYPTTFDLNTAHGRYLDSLSVYDWIELRVPGGHRSPLGQMLDVAYNIEFGAETTRQSSLNLVYLLGYNASPGNFSVFGLSDERFHVDGGNQRVTDAMAAELGARIERGARMESLRRESDGTYTVAIRQGGTTRDVRADHVILALHFAVLRTLDLRGAGFDEQKLYAIRNLGLGRNGKLNLQFQTRLWAQRGEWGLSNGNSYADVGYQSTWEATRGTAGTNGILVAYSGGDVTAGMKTSAPFATASSAQALFDTERTLAQLDRVYPGLSRQWNGRATQSLPHKDPNYGCSYSCWAPGQYTTIAGTEKLPQGRCVFAGEHTSTDYQGWMEGGAESGARAANEVLTAIGRR